MVKGLDKRGLAAFERCIRELLDGEASAPGSTDLLRAHGGEINNLASAAGEV